MKTNTTRVNEETLGRTTFCPVKMVPQGDGSFVVKPGRPLQRLTPEEFGKAVGLSRNSIYRHIDEGSIPEEYVEFAGPRKITIDAAAVEFFKDHWKQKRGDG